MGLENGTWTGFHFPNPVTQEHNITGADLLYSTGRWGAVFLLSGTADGSANTDSTDAMYRGAWVNQQLGNPGGLNQSVTRIYHPNSLNLDTIPSVEAADNFLSRNGYYAGIQTFVDMGGENIAIFNELNVDVEPQHDVDPRVMGYLGFAVNNAFYNGGDRKTYTLFPGPSGLMDKGSFTNYYKKYDLLNASGIPRTFGEFYGGNVDPLIAGRTMLYHDGRGVYDRSATHSYADSPDELASGGPENRALQYVSWTQEVDPSGWIYLTEVGGQSVDPNSGYFGDSYVAGMALADLAKNVDTLNGIPGAFNGKVKGVYGYILEISDQGATSGGRHRIGWTYAAGFNDRRGQLDF